MVLTRPIITILSNLQRFEGSKLSTFSSGTHVFKFQRFELSSTPRMAQSGYCIQYAILTKAVILDVG